MAALDPAPTTPTAAHPHSELRHDGADLGQLGLELLSPALEVESVAAVRAALRPAVCRPGDGNNFTSIDRIGAEAAARGVAITIVVDFIHVLRTGNVNTIECASSSGATWVRSQPPRRMMMASS